MGRDPKGSPPHQRRRRPGKTRRRSCFCFIGLKKYSAAKKKRRRRRRRRITNANHRSRRCDTANKKKTKNGAGDARLTAAFGSRPILISATIYGAVGRLSLRIHRPSSTHFNAATSHNKKTNKQTNKQKSKTNSSKKKIISQTPSKADQLLAIECYCQKKKTSLKSSGYGGLAIGHRMFHN